MILRPECLGGGTFDCQVPSPEEASTRIWLLIYINTPIQINRQTLVTSVITEDILSIQSTIIVQSHGVVVRIYIVVIAH
jgi:hypothetical protein